MPLSRYDRLYGGKRGSAAKAKRKMAETYGADRGERIFYGHNANLAKAMNGAARKLRRRRHRRRRGR